MCISLMENKMEVDIENYEEECGWPCGPDGCRGHDSGIPQSIHINGFELILKDFANGDWPFLDMNGTEIPGEIERWEETVREIEQRLTK